MDCGVKKDTSQFASSPPGLRVTTGAVMGIFLLAVLALSMYAKFARKPFCVASPQLFG